MTTSDQRMHLEREDVTVSGQFSENEPTTTATPMTTVMSSGHHTKSFFHSDDTTYLFKEWMLTSASDTVIACLVLFLVAIAYEGIKTYQKELLKKKYSHSNCYPVATQATADRTNCESRPWLRQMFSVLHLLSTVVHVFQVIIGYALMLAVMTMNVWLVVAVISGAGCGYFLFSWKRRQAANESADNCYLNKSFVGDFNATGFK